jgi:hypothetical protein
LETTGLQSFAVSPILAILLGTPTTVEAVYLRNYAPDFNLQLRRKLNSVGLSAAYARGITPGNGVILTSVRQSGTLGVDYLARRRWSLNGTGGYDSLTGFGTEKQSYTSVFVGASVLHPIVRHLDWHARVDFHHYTFDSTGFLRNSMVFSTGLIWSPGNILEHLW